MAKNDAVLLDSLLQQQLAAKPDTDVGELFERFVLEQILKNFDLSNEELDFGWTDGSLDGGIDGFYVLVNGRLLTDPKDFSWPRSAAEIQVFLVTCKHHDTFQQVPLDAMLASVQELFDLSRNTANLTGSYSAEIRKCREVFIAAFRQLSLYRPTLSFKVIYASRGDTRLLGDSVSARAKQLTTLLSSYFSASTATFTALGASELVELHREVKSFALDLPVQECLTADQEGYVVLARLKDYGVFVSDDKGQLRRYLFDSNVRAFLGGNLVNVDIAQTLANPLAPNFWWLNNGVTILATSASLVGKTLKLKDIQIVNGLQTTESIYRHYATSPSQQEDRRSLLVKVIVSQEESVRDQVIRATNNQSLVEPAALHATDRIQRNIEEILIRHDWYYERRTNYFKNEGRPEARIISPLVMATGSVALLLKNPVKSSKLKQKHLRTTEAYQAVYSETFPIDAWPVVAALIRGAEIAILRSQQARHGGRGQYLSAWRGLLAYLAAVRTLGTFSYSLRQLASLDVSLLTETYMSECWTAMVDALGGLGSNKLNEGRLTRITEAVTSLWALSGQPTDGRRDIPSIATYQVQAPKSTEPEEFLKAVNDALPPQPWKPGVHITVAQQIKVKPFRVSKAIQTLIARGVWMQQRDGVVFDQLGNELMRDETRSPKLEG
ncbi:AIPR family protein [Methylomonas sp. EFPC3]|uniref:AIPR family protein n=1 Tax=Methylomonas sp. EFPC3 TaxID=3021710 RepID=UPI002415CB07|nr:AIPR family protein [Methylomonas sp. EFPC3]WFP48955.1 AIPR family protein [Methylomonas sp. EFPC3]